MNYGFIGLGNLGSKLAINLINTGFSLTVYDKNSSLLNSLSSKGVLVVISVEELSENVDHLITCFPPHQISYEVANKSLPHLIERASWKEMSTISKEDILRFAEFAKKYNAGMLELPINGDFHLLVRGKKPVERILNRLK